MSVISYQERMTALKNTEMFKKLESGKFSFKTALGKVQVSAYDPKTAETIKDELRVAADIYHSLMIQNGYLPKSYREKIRMDFRRDVLVRLVKKCGLNPDEPTLQKFYKNIKTLLLAAKAVTRFEYTEIPRELSKNKVIGLLRSIKGSRIMYDNGMYVLTPVESYGGVICGFIAEEVVRSLIRDCTISQDMYFNADGRKSFSLNYRGKLNKLPTALQGLGLSSSYLRACGVR